MKNFTFWAIFQVTDTGEASNILYLVPILALLSGWVLIYILHFVRVQRIYRGNHHPDSTPEMEIAAEADACIDEFHSLAMCLSFLVSQAFRRLVGEQMPSPDGSIESGHLCFLTRGDRRSVFSIEKRGVSGRRLVGDCPKFGRSVLGCVAFDFCK